MSVSRIRILRSEKGMIAIITTMVLLVIISLIVLGFSRLTRRDQRATLDRQLSTQAFYAAETAVNDARQVIAKFVAEHPDLSTADMDRLKKDTCNQYAVPYNFLSPTVDSAKNVRYTCLTVDPSPQELRYSNVRDSSIVVPIFAPTTPAGNGVRKISIKAQSKTGSLTPLTGTPPANMGCTLTNFPTVSAWTDTAKCGYGVLHIDITPVSGNALTLDGLSSRTMTVFAMPRSGGAGSVVYNPGPSNPAIITDMNCTNDECSMDITNLTEDKYYIRVASLYQPMSLQIGADDTLGKMAFRGAQAIIDATGQAGDVLRRIQVHVPMQSSSRNQMADYALQTKDSICKRFWTMDGRTLSEPNGITGPGQLCQAFDRHL